MHHESTQRQQAEKLVETIDLEDLIFNTFQYVSFIDNIQDSESYPGEQTILKP